ncbi:hypothetical protein E2320_011113 [Naja naja]|nr:hypothetical protein E2320_011113 [Naja naja]
MPPTVPQFILHTYGIYNWDAKPFRQVSIQTYLSCNVAFSNETRLDGGGTQERSDPVAFPPKKPEGTASLAPFALSLAIGKRRRRCCPPSSEPASTRPTARGACGRALKRRVLSLRFCSCTRDLCGKHECGLDWLWLCCIGCFRWSSWLCSVPSLAAGVLCGGLAGLGAYQQSIDPKNIWLSLAASGTLTVLMGMRYYNSRKFMPAGLIAGASLLMVGKLGLQMMEKPL